MTRCNSSLTSTSLPTTTTFEPTRRPTLPKHGDQRSAPPHGFFGSKPGTYGAGLLQLIDSRNWRGRRPISQRSTPHGAASRMAAGLDGTPRSRRHEPAVQANRRGRQEHRQPASTDIADSDDYFQYHGGMIATVRALTGQSPAAYNRRQPPGPTLCAPARLSEETTRVFRARVVNPRWMTAMRRHGYKGRIRDGRHRRLPVRLRPLPPG